MRQRLRENAVCALAAAGGCAAMAWLGLYTFGWNDYETEVQPAFEALQAGHVAEFLRLAPVYGGSLIERAPFALLPGLWGGGQLAVYRLVAVPGLLAAAWLGVWLAARMRTAGAPMLARALTAAIVVANPLTLSALEIGHSEEVLGGCLCVAAVLACRGPAGRGRAVLAGALLGLAIANKEWALLAAGPVVLALRAEPGGARRRLAATLSAGGVAALLLAPLLLASSARFAAGTRAITLSAGAPFKPWQVFWFFGSHGKPVSAETPAGFRAGPAWAATISHPLIIVVGLGLTGAAWLRYRRSARPFDERDGLLLLSLVLLLRCMLDTWDIGYYMLPFMLALVAWEAAGEGGRPPLLALGLVVLPWFALQQLAPHGFSPDAQSVVFLLWTVPLAVWLGSRLFCVRSAAPASLPRSSGQPRGSWGPAQAMTVNARGRLVSGSQPLSPTTTSSSMRTPSTPGR